MRYAETDGIFIVELFSNEWDANRSKKKIIMKLKVRMLLLYAVFALN